MTNIDMLRIYNTLSRSVENFKPINSLKVGMYSCGPTVYDYQHIGHMRRYVGDDILVRVLRLNGYQVKHVMNITDVGHLVSDADEGEDKMEKGARKFGKSVWDIAKMFEKQFIDSSIALHISLPANLMHATDYNKEQIELIKILEEKEYTYRIDDGIYFNTSKFPDYFKLSRQNPNELKKGARVEFVEGKKNAADFALWKFSYPVLQAASANAMARRRQMEWESPWGIGFPGWHIECSAMAMKALGETLDIHTGGIDHINIHHTNEIAQSEAATGKKFVNYWMHHNFLLVNGQKMSKSLENFYTVQDVIKKGFDPLALRYLYLQTHYRKEMNFTWEALEAAQTALHRLQQETSSLKFHIDKKYSMGCTEFEQKFKDALSDDLNTAKALALTIEMIISNDLPYPKILSLKKFDEVLGLDLLKQEAVEINVHDTITVTQTGRAFIITSEVEKLLKEREDARKENNYILSDQLREKIKQLGFEVQDKKEGFTLKKNLQ